MRAAGIFAIVVAAIFVACASTPRCARTVFSEDRCQRDADCDLDSPCHAMHCVKRAHGFTATHPDLDAGLEGVVCTMEEICPSADTHACGCVEGRCALYTKR